jgi:hypothetical protein
VLHHKAQSEAVYRIFGTSDWGGGGGGGLTTSLPIVNRKTWLGRPVNFKEFPIQTLSDVEM